MGHDDDKFTVGFYLAEVSVLPSQGAVGCGEEDLRVHVTL